MNIGLDIDNVISNFDTCLLEEYIKYDKTLRNKGIINENAEYITRGMFDMTDEESDTFYYNNIERIAKNLKPLHNAKKYIDKLKEDGNKIYIISGRDNNEYTNPYEMTKEWLDKYEIYYDELILTNAYDHSSKSEVCIKCKIDIMIDDSVKTLRSIAKENIKVLLMNKRLNKHCDEFERVFSWEEIYTKISSQYPKKEVEKINVILDTDTYNECDDQFALAYLLKSQDRFNIDAITIAPYRHDNALSVKEGVCKSYDEAVNVCKLAGYKTDDKVFKGSEGFLTEGYKDTNDAVEKIIEIASKNTKTYIIAIGAITNVALAIKKEPKIKDKIKVVWLGGHSMLSQNNDEFNFRGDVHAVKEVLNSKVDLTIIPCKNVASNLVTSIYELEYHLKGKNELCDFLCSRFYNDEKHGIQTRRVIWDISAVTYLLNRNWFEVSTISCPDIAKDTSYIKTENKHLINVVNNIDVNKVYNDLFKKLGGK